MTRTINRREFLKRGAAATAATMAATPGLTYAQVVGGGAPFDDYRALVCVFLFGGNDSFNMLVPNTTPTRRRAKTSRSPGKTCCLSTRRRLRRAANRSACIRP